MSYINIPGALKDLINSGKDLSVDSTTAALQVFNFAPGVLPYTDKAKLILACRAYSTVHQYNEWSGPAKSKFYEDDSRLRNVVEMLEKLEAIEQTDVFETNGPTYTRKMALCRFFGVQVDPVDFHAGATMIANLVNQLVDEDCVKACLSEPVIIPFASGKLAIVAYLNIVDGKDTYVESKYKQFMFPEGDAPIKIEDVV